MEMHEPDFENFDQKHTRWLTKKKASIIKKVLWGGQDLNHFRKVTKMEGLYIATNAEMSEVSQGYQTGFHHKGDLELDMESFHLRRQKGNFQYDPINYIDKWVSYMMENNFTTKEYPMVRFITDMMVKKILDDKIKKQLFNGFYKKPNPDHPNDAINAVDGLGVMIKRGLKRGLIGILSKDMVDSESPEFVKWVKEMHKKIPRIFRRETGFKCHMPALWDENRYDTLKDKSIGLGDSKIEPTMTLGKGKTPVVGLDCMDEANFMFFTYTWNMVMAMSGRSGKFKAKDGDHSIKVLGDWGWGVGFDYLPFIWLAGNPMEMPEIVGVEENTSGILTLKWGEVPETDEYLLTIKDSNGAAVNGFDSKVITTESKQEMVQVGKRKMYPWRITEEIPGLQSGQTYTANLEAVLKGPKESFKSPVATQSLTVA